jgi:hypothetical protein
VDGAVTMAEESTDLRRLPSAVMGGLGFWYKWNLGWMHDTLDYMKLDPVHRKYHHDKLTFGMLYNYTENFMLPLSHDEVVHGKKSILDRMPGDAWQKFANLRAYYGWMFAFPGKNCCLWAMSSPRARVEPRRQPRLASAGRRRQLAPRRAASGARPEPDLSPPQSAARARLRSVRL